MLIPQLRFALVVLSLSALLAACNSQSPSEQLKEELRTQRSWAATLRMIAENWMSGALPKPYARTALENIAQALAKQSETLTKSSDIPAEQKAKAAERLESLKQIAASLEQAVEKTERATLGPELEKVKNEEEAIRKNLAESVGEPTP